MHADGTSGSSAWVITRCSTRLERAASLPPFSTSPLPERSASAATCGSASGRLSKMTITTPMGAVSSWSSRPSASSVRDSTLPSGSSCSAMSRMPSASLASLRSSSFRRAASAGVMLPLATASAASATSRAFSRRISAAFSVNAPATRTSTAARASLLRLERMRPASRAAMACCLGVSADMGRL